MTQRKKFQTTMTETTVPEANMDENWLMSLPEEWTVKQLGENGV